MKAFEHISAAAEAGLPEAQFHLGALYARGVFGKEHAAKTRAARTRTRPSGTFRETKALRTRRRARDHAKAFYNFNLAAGARHGDNTTSLSCSSAARWACRRRARARACCSRPGERGAWAGSVEEARAVPAAGASAGLVKYMKVAEAGVEVAQANAAFVLDRAEPWYEAPTEARDASSFKKNKKFEGRFARTTAAGSDRERRALHYHKLAADQGNVLSLLKIGDAYFYGRAGGRSRTDDARDGDGEIDDDVSDFSSRNVSAAVYLRATQHRSAQAMFNPGAMHEHGLGRRGPAPREEVLRHGAEHGPEGVCARRLALWKLQAHKWLAERAEGGGRAAAAAAAAARLAADLVALVSPRAGPVGTRKETPKATRLARKPAGTGTGRAERARTTSRRRRSRRRRSRRSDHGSGWTRG